MQLRHLKAFLTVRDEGSLNRAAIRLNMAQPALSKQMNQLEDELGFAVLDRTPRGAALTAAGEIYAQEIQSIFVGLDNARSRAHEVATRQLSIPRFGVVRSATRFAFLAKALRQNKESGASVRVSRLSIEALRMGLAVGEFDIALTYSGLAPFPGAKTLLVHSEEIQVALPSTHPLAAKSVIRLQDLADESFIFGERASGPAYTDLLKAACTAAGFTPQIMYECESSDTFADMVRSGLGISFMSSSSVTRSDFQGVVLKRISNLDFFLNLELAWLPRQPRIARLLECLLPWVNAHRRLMSARQLEWASLERRGDQRLSCIA